MIGTKEKLLNAKIVAIVRGLKEGNLLSLAAALYAGGITAMEVTFDQSRADGTEATASAIALLNERFGDAMLVGAGTVMTPAQVDAACSAGAKYIISPGVSRAVIERTRELGLVSMPGALTPTEIMDAHAWGADIVKVFPAGNMGPQYIKAIRAPLNHIVLFAVGGIDEKNAADYLRAGCAGVGVGGKLVNKEWIEAGALDKIEALAREYVHAVKEI